MSDIKENRNIYYIHKGNNENFSPFELQGIETLSLRMERHCENSMKVALHLRNHPFVAWVRYPGLPEDMQYEKAQKYLKGTGGAIVIFGIKSDDAKEAGKKFIDNLTLLLHVANCGMSSLSSFSSHMCSSYILFSLLLCNTMQVMPEALLSTLQVPLTLS